MASILVIDSRSAPGAVAQRLRDDLSARKGHQVVFAASCDEALVLLEHAVPDLVVFPVFFSAAQEKAIVSRLGTRSDGDPLSALLVPLVASDALDRTQSSSRWFYWFKPQAGRALLDGREIRALAERIRASLGEATGKPPVIVEATDRTVFEVASVRVEQPAARTTQNGLELVDDEQWKVLEESLSSTDHGRQGAARARDFEPDIRPILEVSGRTDPTASPALLPDSENASVLREWADEILGLTGRETKSGKPAARPGPEIPAPRRLEAVPFKQGTSVTEADALDVVPTSASIHETAGEQAVVLSKSSSIHFKPTFLTSAKSEAPERDLPQLAAETGKTRLIVSWWRRPSRGAWLSGIAATLLVAAGAAFAGDIAAAAKRFAGEAPAGIAELHTVPSGSEVWTGGRKIGVTPLHVALAEGPHEIEFRYRKSVRVVQLTIAADKRTIHREELNYKPVGELRVTSNPEGASVMLDGQDRGVTPVTISDVPAGRHLLLFKGPGGTVQQSIVVEDARTTTAEASIYSGWVAIFSPFEIHVSEAGRELVFDENQQAMLSPGRHTLRLVNEALGYADSRVVDIAPGEVTRVSVDLPQTTVTLTSVPSSEVWLDGVRIGETPLTKLPVGVGAREFVFRHPTMGERRIVRIATTAELNIDVDLTQPGQ